MVLSCVSSVRPQCGHGGVCWDRDVRRGTGFPSRWTWVSVCPLDSMAFCVVLGIEFRASCMLGQTMELNSSSSLYSKSFKRNVLACEHRD